MKRWVPGSGFARGIGVLVWMALLTWAAPDAWAEDPPSDAEPFPIRKTTTVRGRGTRYYIDGPTVIPDNAKIRIEQGVTLLGINGATLEVRGGLDVHGTQDTWVTIMNVDFSPTSEPKFGFYLDMADLHGCKFKHGEEQALGGEFTIENSCFQRDCVFDVRIGGGFLKIMTVEFGMTCNITSVRPAQDRRPVEIEVRSSWMKEIRLAGAAMANFRHSEIRGGLLCKDVTQVMVDGCDISNTLSFQQPDTGTFKKITVTKCNLLNGATLVLARPTGPKTKRERVRIDKCFFGPKNGDGIRDEEEVRKLIHDGTDEAKSTVKVIWTKLSKHQHLLVNYDTLRDRAPDLR